MLAGAGVPGAVGGLLDGEVFERAFDDFFGGVVDGDVVLDDGRSGGGFGDVGDGANAECRMQNAE
jgi:hypothetical protein